MIRKLSGSFIPDKSWLNIQMYLEKNNEWYRLFLQSMHYQIKSDYKNPDQSGNGLAGVREFERHGEWGKAAAAFEKVIEKNSCTFL